MSPNEELLIDVACAQPYSLIRYEAYRIPEGTERAYPLRYESAPRSLSDAVETAKVRCFHKDKLVIRETETLSNETKLHLYAVKRQARPTYVYRDYQTHREHPLYVEPVCVIGGEVLS